MSEQSLLLILMKKIGTTMCLSLFFPSSAYAFLEGPQHGINIFTAILFVGVIWSGLIVVSVIEDDDPLSKPVLIIAGAIVINLIFMFTSLIGLLVSLVTLPILILALFWIYYEM